MGGTHISFQKHFLAVINPIVFLTHLIAYLIVTGLLGIALRQFSKKEWYRKLFIIFVIVIFSWPLILTIWAMEAVKNSFEDYSLICGVKAPKGTRDILFFLPIGL